MRIIAVIPARYASTRLPGKPLIEINGITMIQRVYERVKRVSGVDKILVATDDDRILQHVLAFGGNAVMTSAELPSGTERCVEAIEQLNETFDFAINIQGDEPFIAPELIEQVIESFGIETQVVTAVKQITDSEVLFNPNVVKAVLSESHHALYFSRQTLPFVRDEPTENWLAKTKFYKHIGIYGFKTEVLKQLVKLPISVLETTEKLEQLRWLANGFSVRAVITEHESIGIDTPEDLVQFSINQKTTH